MKRDAEKEEKVYGLRNKDSSTLIPHYQNCKAMFKKKCCDIGCLPLVKIGQSILCNTHQNHHIGTLKRCHTYMYIK